MGRDPYRRGSGHLADERADRFPYLHGVAKEPVATAFDADELGAGDALGRPDGEPVRRERRVVLALMTSVGTATSSRGNRSAARFETNPSKTAPSRLGLRGNRKSAIASDSRDESRYPFGLPIIRVYAPGMTLLKIQKRRSAL